MERTPAEQMRFDQVTDTFASFALDGRLPTKEDLRLARAYVAGDLTLEEVRQQTIARFAHLTPEPPAGV